MDNSDYMRNGDYAPTRLLAQAETINKVEVETLFKFLLSWPFLDC